MKRNEEDCGQDSQDDREPSQCERGSAGPDRSAKELPSTKAAKDTKVTLDLSKGVGTPRKYQLVKTRRITKKEKLNPVYTVKQLSFRKSEM